jgi:hypothetical protein
LLKEPISDAELWKLCSQKDQRVMWVLYESPYDFPNQWVARFFLCDTDKPRPTKWVEKGGYRDNVVACLPYIDKGRWKFTPEYDPFNPQIIGVYT